MYNTYNLAFSYTCTRYPSISMDWGSSRHAWCYSCTRQLTIASNIAIGLTIDPTSILCYYLWCIKTMSCLTSNPIPVYFTCVSGHVELGEKMKIVVSYPVPPVRSGQHPVALWHPAINNKSNAHRSLVVIFKTTEILDDSGALTHNVPKLGWAYTEKFYIACLDIYWLFGSIATGTPNGNFDHQFLISF